MQFFFLLVNKGNKMINSGLLLGVIFQSNLLLPFIILNLVFFSLMSVIVNLIHSNMLYGGIEPRLEKALPIQHKAQLAKKSSLVDNKYRMQRKILVSPKKGVGCRFQIIIDHGNKRQYLHFANQNTIDQLLVLASQIKIPNCFNNTQHLCYSPLSKCQTNLKN